MIDNITQEESFLNLPKNIQEVIIKYAKPCIGFNSVKSAESLPIISSKLGGTPFIAKGKDLPRGKNNTPYFMVIQLNFEQIRNEVGQHPDLPKTGLLQIFINALDPNYGLVGESSSSSPQVVRYFEDVPLEEDNDKALTEEYNEFFKSGCDFYHTDRKLMSERVKWKEREEKLQELPFYKNYGTPYFPVVSECKLVFKAELSLPLSNSIDIEFNEGEQLWNDIGEAGKEYLNQNTCQHRLVGFLKGYRTGDPRYLWGFVEGVPEHLLPYVNKVGDVVRDDLQVFLELDSFSDGETRMSWWDFAQAHFLIKHTDLEKRDFNDMEFHVES